MARIAGEDRPILWLSAADVRSIAECREIWQRETGRKPKRFPMPQWLFERFVGPDLVRMWQWLATHNIHADTAETRAHLPEALTVEEFVRRRAGRAR